MAEDIEATHSATDSVTLASTAGAVSASIDRHGRSVIRVRGEHDLSTLDDVAAAAASAIAGGAGDVIIDLRDASFIDASTIGVMVRAHMLLRASGRDITIRSPSPQTRLVIDVCGESGRIDGHDHGLAASTLIVPIGNEPA